MFTKNKKGGGGGRGGGGRGGGASRPGCGYICKLCGACGGTRGAHWVQHCPLAKAKQAARRSGGAVKGGGKACFSLAKMGKALPFVALTTSKDGRKMTAKQTVQTVRYVPAGGGKQKTRAAAPVKPKTVAVIFVIDESTSMAGAKFDAAKGEIVRITKRVLGPHHYVGVLGFGSSVTVYQKPVMKRSLKAGIEAVVGKCHVHGATALYDAIAQAISMVKFHAGSHVQIVCLTDGQDNRSTAVTYTDLCAQIARPGMANGAKGFFHLTVIGVGRDVDRNKLEAMCAPRHAQYLGVGAAGKQDMGAQVRKAFAVVEQQLVRVVTTHTRTVTVQVAPRKKKAKGKPRAPKGGGRNKGGGRRSH